MSAALAIGSRFGGFSISKGVLLAMLSAAGFSAKAIFVKLAYVYPVDAITLLMLRMAFSLPFFILMAGISGRGAARLPRQAWMMLLPLGLMGYYLSSVFDFIGLQYVSSTLERLVLFLYPTFVLLFSALLFRRKVGLREWLALGLCYLGTGLAVAHDWHALGAGQSVLIGVSWVLASALCYSLYLIGTGELVKQVGALRLSAWLCIVASLAIIVHFLLTHPLSAAFNLPWPVYAYSLAMALISTVLPVALMNEAIRRVGANQVALVSTLGPVITLFLGWLVLSESMSLLQIVGAALVVGGVASVSLRKK